MELNDFTKSLMYKAIMSEKTNGIVCECETHPNKGWIKWYDSEKECLLNWKDLIEQFESKDQFTMYYPNEFEFEDGVFDRGDYALVYNKREELVYYLHILCKYYDDIYEEMDQSVLDTALSA